MAITSKPPQGPAVWNVPEVSHLQEVSKRFPRSRGAEDVGLKEANVLGSRRSEARESLLHDQPSGGKTAGEWVYERRGGGGVIIRAIEILYAGCGYTISNEDIVDDL